MEYYMANKSGYLDGKETLLKFEFFPLATWRLNVIKKSSIGSYPMSFKCNTPLSHWFSFMLLNIIILCLRAKEMRLPHENFLGIFNLYIHAISQG